MTRGIKNSKHPSEKSVTDNTDRGYGAFGRARKNATGTDTGMDTPTGTGFVFFYFVLDELGPASASWARAKAELKLR